MQTAYYEVRNEMLYDGRTYRAGDAFDASKVTSTRLKGLQATRKIVAHPFTEDEALKRLEAMDAREKADAEKAKKKATKGEK